MIITGGNGLLGSTFKDIKNTELHTRDKANLMDIEKTALYFEKNRSNHDTIIHSAATVGGVKANMDNNYKFFRENKIINDTVMELAMYFDYKCVVNMLSTCIFPDKVNYPLTADQIDNGKPHPTNWGYAYAKRLLGYETKMYKDITGNNWLSIIPTNLYGLNDNYNLDSSHIIPALIHKAYLAKQSGETFEVWGDGTPVRQFMFAEDLRDITLWAIDNWKEDRPLMAVNEKEYSIKEIAHIIADRFDVTGRMVFNTNMPNGQMKKPAKSDVPDWEFTGLDEGLNRTIDHFISNYDNIRK